MTTPSITMADGGKFDLPLFDPIVAARVNDPASNVATLLHQINEEKIYAPLFPSTLNPQLSTFLDLGANIGLVSLYAAPVCARIVAVEPDPGTFTVLKAMTNGQANIECVRAALSPRDGDCEFYQNDLNTTASSTVNTYGERILVPGFSLTSLLSIYQLESVDVCKIDAEGAEGESLSFPVLTLAKPIIKSYYIETHNCPKSRWEQKLGRLVQDLSTLGYHRQTINGMTLWARLP